MEAAFDPKASAQALAHAVGQRDAALEALEKTTPAASLTSEQLGRISKTLRGELASNDDVKRTIALGDDKYVDITNHAIERAMQRSVEEFDLVDALQNPLRTTTIKYDEQGRPSCQLIRKKATVAINPETGAILTIWPTHRKTAEKLKGRQKQ